MREMMGEEIKHSTAAVAQKKRMEIWSALAAGGTNQAWHMCTPSIFLTHLNPSCMHHSYATKSSFQFSKNNKYGKVLHQNHDFSTIHVIKWQFEKRWRQEKSVIYMGLMLGQSKTDYICGKTTVTGKCIKVSLCFKSDMTSPQSIWKACPACSTLLYRAQHFNGITNTEH
jgi:hypothetical protein